MIAAQQQPGTNPDEFGRCEERGQIEDHGKMAGAVQKADLVIRESIYRAFQRDDFLRALESDEIDVRVRNGVVYLNGHIVGGTSQSRIDRAMGAIPGILGIRNGLVLDDTLTLEIAGSLGKLEHAYGCKFFTGVSHGVVSLNGTVRDENVKLLAEKYAAGHPNARGVINNVRVQGSAPGWQESPFLQPAIGAVIHFLDGVSGVVKQVVINPNNRRVVAMTVQGRFSEQRAERNSQSGSSSRLPDELVAVPMNAVRYMTTVSGFLKMNSTERLRYMEFDPTHFFIPKKDWKAPFPYCPQDVLFPVERQDLQSQISREIPALEVSPLIA